MRIRNFPFINAAQAVTLLRICLAGIFIAHAVTRIVNNTIPQFAGFLASKGWPIPVIIVWSITIFELSGGVALAAGICKKSVTAGFIILLLTGIAVIHAARGWFVGEHGSGGCEYSVALIAALLVVAAHDNNRSVRKIVHKTNADGGL